MSTSVWSDMWALVRYARSRGVDQVCEQGTLKKGFSIVGINFAVQMSFILVYLTISNILLYGFMSYPPLEFYAGELVITFALPLINAAGIWAYIRLVSNPNLTYIRTATVVMYSFTYALVLQIIRYVMSIIAVLLSYHGFYNVAGTVGSAVSLAGIVLAIYFFLCCIHLFRKGLDTTLVHTIIACIVGLMVCFIVIYGLSGFDGVLNALPDM